MQCILALDREDFQSNYQIQMHCKTLDLIFVSVVGGVSPQIQISTQIKRYRVGTLLFFICLSSSARVALCFWYVRSGLKFSNRKTYHSSANHASKGCIETPSSYLPKNWPQTQHVAILLLISVR